MERIVGIMGIRGGPIGAAVAAGAIALLPIASPAGAAQCRLTELASVKLSTAPDGLPLVPVTLDGTPENLSLDLEDPFSFLAWDAGARLKLKEILLPHPDTTTLLGGEQLKDLHFQGKVRALSVSTMQLGSLAARDVHFYSGPDIHSLYGIAGGIGLDFLGSYDVELDLAHDTLNLFDPKHCPGQVVYWTHSPVAVVDMTEMPGGTFQYAFSLNGKPVTAFVATDSVETRFAFPTARELFNLTHSSTGVSCGNAGATGCTYPFKTLDANGIGIANPDIHLYGNEYVGLVCDSRVHESLNNTGYLCRGDAALKIGVHELRHLHLYFAFAEKKLYVTAADAE